MALSKKTRIALAAAPVLIFAAALPLLFCGTNGSPSRAEGVSDANVRPSALAGSWYLKDPEALRRRLGLYLERAGKPKLGGRPLAIVSPHAGHLYAGQAMAYGFKALEGRDIRRVIVMGLTHRAPLSGVVVSGYSAYETPLGRVPLDRKACEQLRLNPLFGDQPSVERDEHSIEIQLPFLQAVLKEGFELVPILFGSLKDEEYAAAAKEIAKLVDDKTLVVASSDFTHYGRRFDYAPFARDIPANIEALDRKAVDAILKKDRNAFDKHVRTTGATICGRVPIGVLLELLPKSARGTLLRYYRSADIGGAWDGSVSYADILFTEGDKASSFEGSELQRREAAMLNGAEQKELLALARATVEAYVREKKAPDPETLAKTVRAGLKKDMGVFVTLKERGELRGCIGSITGVEPLFRGVVRNAVNAAAFDPRFKPVAPEELKEITVDVSVLSPPAPVKDAGDILPGWHGIVLQKAGRGATFLPQVAVEFGWDTDELLGRLSSKAGLAEDAWKSGAEFEVYEAQIVSE